MKRLLLATVAGFGLVGNAMAQGIDEASSLDFTAVVDGMELRLELAPVAVGSTGAAVAAVPDGYGVDRAAGCFYRLDGQVLVDEFALWSGSCDEAGYASGDGELRYVYPSGAPESFIDFRRGSFRAGALDGPGLMVSLQGDYKAGVFRDGRLQGRGEERRVSGHSYEGDFVDGRAEGEGALRYPDGTFYRGAFESGLPEGFGRVEFENGSVFVGPLHSGKMHGDGQVNSYDGSVLTGHWVEGLLEGDALRRWPNGVCEREIFSRGDRILATGVGCF